MREQICVSARMHRGFGNSVGANSEDAWFRGLALMLIWNQGKKPEGSQLRSFDLEHAHHGWCIVRVTRYK